MVSEDKSTPFCFDKILTVQAIEYRQQKELRRSEYCRAASP